MSAKRSAPEGGWPGCDPFRRSDAEIQPARAPPPVDVLGVGGAARKPIEFEQHSNVLNQYVLHDNQLAILIDNAIPSLGYQKFKNAR